MYCMVYAIVSYFRQLLASSTECGVQGAGKQYAVYQQLLVAW